MKRYSGRLKAIVSLWRMLNLGRKVMEETNNTSCFDYAEIVAVMREHEQDLMLYTKNALKKAHSEFDKRIGCPPSKQAQGIDLFIASDMFDKKVFKFEKRILN